MGLTSSIVSTRSSPQKCKIITSGTATNLQSRCAAIGALYFPKPLALDAFLEKLKTFVQKATGNDDILAGLRRRSQELRELVEVNRTKFRQLAEKYPQLQNRFQDLSSRLKS